MSSTERNYFNELLRKYNAGMASDDEIKFLESFYEMFDVNDDLITDDNQLLYADLKARLKADINNRTSTHTVTPPNQVRVKRLIIRYTAAAAILICALGGAFVFTHNKAKKAKQLAANKIVPGGNRATLKLANGKIIDLTGAHDGILAQEANIQIHKNADGLLVYTAAGNKIQRDADGNIQRNTISTPNGGQYQVVLPDGSKVMLNAASSLTYPVAFEGKERAVELNGEAYFEVAHNKAMPFRVKCARQTVTVLGTHFNINAYYDESAIKTTLLEGAVAVAAGSSKAVITPGEQALVGSGDQLSKRQVDVDKEVAWKNGVFSFDGDDIRSVMRQVARWYDVSVVFNGNFTDDKFYGEISRSSSLNDVIKILKLSNVNFEVRDRKIIVTEAQ